MWKVWSNLVLCSWKTLTPMNFNKLLKTQYIIQNPKWNKWFTIFNIRRMLLQRIEGTDSELTSSRIFCNIGALRLEMPPPCHLGKNIRQQKSLLWRKTFCRTHSINDHFINLKIINMNKVKQCSSQIYRMRNYQTILKDPL